MTDRIGVAVDPPSPLKKLFVTPLCLPATSAQEIAIQGSWLSPGVHINAIGANFAHKRELDDAVVSRADVIAADSVEQAKMEAGDLIQAFSGNVSRWDGVRELSGIIAGNIPGRTSADQITLFKSVGIATWDPPSPFTFRAAVKARDSRFRSATRKELRVKRRRVRRVHDCA